MVDREDQEPNDRPITIVGNKRGRGRLQWSTKFGLVWWATTLYSYVMSTVYPNLLTPQLPRKQRCYVHRNTHNHGQYIIDEVTAQVVLSDGE